MSKLQDTPHTAGWESQHDNTGSNSSNPANKHYNQQFFDRELADMEKNYHKDGDDPFTKKQRDNPDHSRRTLAEHEASQKNPIKRTRSKTRQAAFKWRGMRGKTSIITVSLVLFGLGGTVTIFSTPSLAIVQLRQIFTQDLNDQLNAFDKRHSLLFKAKLKTDSKGTVAKVAERFANMSNNQVERYANKGTEITRTNVVDGKGKVTKIEFSNSEDASKPITVTNSTQLDNAMQNDVKVRAAISKAENTWFASMTDKVFNATLSKLHLSKRDKISGSTDAEREKSLNNAISSVDEDSANTLVEEKDKNGNPTGRTIGPDGQPVSAEELKNIQESSTLNSQAVKVKPGAILSSIGKGVSIDSVVDSACTIANASRRVGALAKVNRTQMAAAFAMASLLVPADKILAGQGTDEEATFIGNKINNIGGTQQSDTTVDESKIFDNNTTTNTPTTTNNSQYETAFDSPGAKASLYGDVSKLTSSDAVFLLAGGFVGTLAKVNSLLAKAISGGNPDPRVIAQKCRYVQNPYVRAGALVAGIFAGVGTFGLSTAAGIIGSLALSAALPYLLSLAADMATGDSFQNLYGRDFGSAAFVGTSAIFGTASMSRGLKPLSSSEAVAYTSETNSTLATYSETQRYLARATPFDIYNQYSFLGSIASTISPMVRSSASNTSLIALNVASFLPTILNSTISSAKADNTTERFSQCNDTTYEAMGIGADIYCNVRYGLSDKELSIDPVENAQWMVDSGNVAADDETGAAVDNGQSWNYKKYLEQCVNRTVGWGEDEDENQGDGTNCLSEQNEVANEHFRVFTLDLSVQDYMDQDNDGSYVATSQTTTTTNAASASGWVYPTTPNADSSKSITGAYNSESHTGIDLVPDGTAQGKPIYAARDGIVVAAGAMPTDTTGGDEDGSWIVIRHTIGTQTYSTIYSGMEASDIKVTVGQSVKAGDTIATIGNTGTGPHLHFEIWDTDATNPSCKRNNVITTKCSIDPTNITLEAENAARNTNA